MISRRVWMLSMVSLFTDMAGEMLYPVIPVYLKEAGFTVFFIGLLEGIAELIAGLGKGYFGNLSDHYGSRLPFVRWGYGLSAFSKPMLFLSASGPWIFFSRMLDRIGKGIRTGARDAMLSDESTPATRATVFGFHRSWDTLGAVGGPLIALLFLYFFPSDYRHLFLIAFLPGLLALVCLFVLKEKKKSITVSGKRPSFIQFFRYWKTAKPEYKKLVAALLIFGLFNSSDMFLLLRVKEVTGSDSLTLLAYIFYNAVYAVFAWYMGRMADRRHPKKVLAFGLILFAATYFGMAWAGQTWIIFGLFLLYGLYAAATEGVSKAWISNLAGKETTATAIGFLAAFQNFAALGASLLTGAVWTIWGAKAALIPSAAVALGVAFFVATRVSAGPPKEA